MGPRSQSGLTRRELLVLASGAVLLAGCGSEAQPTPTQVVFTIDDLFSTTPFYIAHRGSGDNWPEHTAEAYRQAIAAGAKAIEVSVQATKDGVLVCHHDLNTRRMTGKNLDISKATYADLSGLLNNARQWLGPNSNLLPIPKLQDVLEAHAKDHVIFIEDKQGTNTEALLDLMDSFPNSTKHFVWKQPAGSGRYKAARARGYKSWGYFSPEDFDKIGQLADRFDLTGIHHSASDDLMKKLVAVGKPVVCWEIHTRWMRDRVLALGIPGMMCSNIPYVTTDRPRDAFDQFSTGLRAAGDLPFALAWTHQPEILPDVSSILLEHKDKTSYCMGSVCPITRENYTIQFNMSWPERTPADYEHAGIAFGQRDDSAYRVRERSAVGGYHVILRGNGSLELFGRQAGDISGYQLAAVMTERPKSGYWMKFQVRVTPDEIRIERSDGQGWAATSTDKVYRGGYFSLCRNYSGGPAVQFRAVSAS